MIKKTVILVIAVIIGLGSASLLRMHNSGVEREREQLIATWKKAVEEQMSDIKRLLAINADEKQMESEAIRIKNDMNSLPRPLPGDARTINERAERLNKLRNELGAVSSKTIAIQDRWCPAMQEAVIKAKSLEDQGLRVYLLSKQNNDGNDPAPTSRLEALVDKQCACIKEMDVNLTARVAMAPHISGLEKELETLRKEESRLRGVNPEAYADRLVPIAKEISQKSGELAINRAKIKELGNKFDSLLGEAKNTVQAVDECMKEMPQIAVQ